MSNGADNSPFLSVEVCRLCLWGSGPLLPIFKGDGEHLQLAKKIKTVLPFDVSMDHEGLPKGVCTFCVYKLEMFYGFYESCSNCDNKLKLYLISRTIPEITIEDEPENQTIKVEDSQQKADHIVTFSTECQNQPAHKNQCDGITPSNAPVPGKDNANIITDVKDEESYPEDERYSSGGDPVPFSSTTNSVQGTEPIETTQSSEETWRHDNFNESVPTSNALDHYFNSLSVLSCRYCNKVFYEIRTLHAHEKLHNGGILLYSCRTCGKEFYSDSDLKIHVKISCTGTQDIHNDSQFTATCTAGSVSFPCTVCNKILRSAASLLKHKKSRQHLMRLKNINGPSVKSSAQRLVGKASKTSKTTNKSLVLKNKLVPRSSRVSNNSSTIHQLKRKFSSSVAKPAVVKKRKKLK